jgi:hypothetical protein
MMDVADLSGPDTEASLAWGSRALNRAPPESKNRSGGLDAEEEEERAVRLVGGRQRALTAVGAAI